MAELVMANLPLMPQQDTDIYGPVQRAQQFKQQQNALLRQQQVRNALSNAIDPRTGRTNWQFAMQTGGADVAPELQDLRNADFASQVKLAGDQATTYKTGVDADKQWLANAREQYASGVFDQNAHTAWRNRVVAEKPFLAPSIPEKFDPATTRTQMLTTADKAIEQHFQTVDTGGGGYTLQMPAMGGAATEVPGSRFTKTLSPDQRAKLDQEAETGNYSEESKNVMAGLVAQGYPLPIPLGRGSKSDALKNDIYERAARITRGLPPSPSATPAPSQTKPGAAPAANTPPAMSPTDVASAMGGARQDQAARGQSIRYYSSGRGNQIITSLNTAVDHLDTLSELATALNNNDVKLINRFGQAWKEQTGEAAPTNLDSAKVIIAREILKAITASGGGVKEAEELQATMDRANSPDQLAGAVSTYQKLLAGQLESIGAQYKVTTNRDDFDTRLSERTKRVLGRGKTAAAPAQKTVTRTGTINGRKVIQYSDGSVEYAD